MIGLGFLGWERGLSVIRVLEMDDLESGCAALGARETAHDFESVASGALGDASEWLGGEEACEGKLLQKEAGVV